MFLARSVTGTYRAVKVVRREDFERERTFEREFEGIQRYEKVSQDHPGLVDVLHAGRNDREGYYYYVMELADDVETGSEIDVDRYTPRTLSSDLRQHRLRSVRECVSVGALLAEALGHLHQAGLTHRDVKPSNVIFVKGVAKLADVGLVASSGQRTFVGTEGYVPPEGPGTALADLYSLAMVLYEMGTGKDRLEFPELPTNLELPPTVNRDEWRALNAVICRAGAPDPRRRFENGAALAAALRRIVEPDAARSPSWRRALLKATAALAIAALGAVAFSVYRDWQSPPPPPPSSPPSPPRRAGMAAAPDLPETRPPAPAPVPSGLAANLPDAFSLSPPPTGEMFTSAGGSVSSGAKDGSGVVFTDPALPAKTAPPPPSPPPPSKAWLRITQPSGATVWLGDKPLLDAHSAPVVTPTDYLEFAPGPVTLVLKAPGYYDFKLSRTLRAEQREVESEIQMIPDRGPVEGQDWANSTGLAFRPLGKHHITIDPVPSAAFERFLSESRYPLSLVVPASVRAAAPEGQALADTPSMWAFCDWLTAKDRAEGFLNENQFHHPQPDNDADPVQPFYSRIENRFGSLLIASEPAGATVYDRSVQLGQTPLTIQRQRIGLVQLVMKLPGYRDTPVEALVRANDLATFQAPLTRDDSILFTETWRNSLEMTFVPVADFMASAFETRVSDYRAFLDTRPEGIVPPSPGFEQEPDHPVAGVNLLEARAFCEWLTRKEQAEGLIEDYHAYRVPTDLQWSAMAGLTAEDGLTPEIRDVRKAPGQFPWGAQWPPPPRSGNFADAASRKTVPGGAIPGYDDGHELTAPVGSFDPNPYEIHDLAGNVWEWIDEPFGGPDSRLFPVRGGSWASFQQSNLLTAFRNALRPEFKRGGAGEYGFRCVVVDTRKDPAGPGAP